MVRTQKKERMMWATLVREGSERRQTFSFPVRDKSRRMKKAEASMRQKKSGEAGWNTQNPFMLCC